MSMYDVCFFAAIWKAFTFDFPVKILCTLEENYHIYNMGALTRKVMKGSGAQTINVTQVEIKP